LYKLILPKLATGDATPEQSLLRHNSLYNLGYPLVLSPYAQPPLTTDDVDGSFDDIMMLLSYFPFDEQTVRNARNVSEYSKPSQQKALNDEVLENSSALEMNVHILFISVKNFYESVFGYETNNDI